MYEFQKLDDEEIILISDESILKVDSEERYVSTIITNKRLLLFDDSSGVNNYQEVLRISRGANYFKKKEVIFEVLLQDISSVTKENDFDKYLLSNTNYFYLRDDKIRSEINKMII